MERQPDRPALAQDRGARQTARTMDARLVLVAFVAIGVAVGVGIAPIASAAAAQPGGVANAGPADDPAIDRIGAAQASAQDDAANGTDTATNDTPNASNDSTPTELAPIDPANATANDTEPIELEDEGQTVTDQFALDDGLLVVSYAHDGESNVQMWLWNESADERQALLVNRIGAVDGVAATPVAAGNYSLEVEADGAWNATLVQPNATAVLEAAANKTAANATDGNGSDANDTDASDGDGNATDATDAQTNRSDAQPSVASAPATASGNGSAVLGPVEFEESVTVTGNHTGESNFIVWLYAENATSPFSGSLVYNEIGEVANAESRVSHTGTSWIVVQADGEWDLTFD